MENEVIPEVLVAVRSGEVGSAGGSEVRRGWQVGAG